MSQGGKRDGRVEYETAPNVRYPDTRYPTIIHG